MKANFVPILKEPLVVGSDDAGCSLIEAKHKEEVLCSLSVQVLCPQSAQHQSAIRCGKLVNQGN